MIGATLFSGGGGVEALLKEHIEFVRAVEFDPQIAAVYAQNIGPHVQVADVRHVDYGTWPRLDYLHASPVCKNFSAAKTNGTESDDDMTTAAAVVRCLEATQPRVFTLENVQAYEGSASYRLIVSWLNHNGYMWHAETLNAANYGVPQTRRRLILRAVRDALLPGLPPPTRWVGWYEAIEDLIPGLPESAFAPWQLARLPEGLTDTVLVNNGGFNGGPLDRVAADRPCFSVVSSLHSKGAMPRAFIVDGQTNDAGAVVTVPHSHNPMDTVSASCDRRPARAWLVNGENMGRDLTIRSDREPAFVTGASAHGCARAWLHSGRVVKMTPRALARFQSFPDSYALPDRASLACCILGNAAPPLLMRAVVLPLIGK